MTLSEKKELLRSIQKQKRAADSRLETNPFGADLIALLKEAVYGLEAEKSREIMRLRYLEGYTAEAAAEQLEMSVRQVIRISNAAVEELKL